MKKSTWMLSLRHSFLGSVLGLSVLSFVAAPLVHADDFKTDDAVKSDSKKVGHDVKHSSQQAGKKAKKKSKKAAKKTSDATSDAAHDTGKAVNDAGDKVQDAAK